MLDKNNNSVKSFLRRQTLSWPRGPFEGVVVGVLVLYIYGAFDKPLSEHFSPPYVSAAVIVFMTLLLMGSLFFLFVGFVFWVYDKMMSGRQ